VTLFLFACGTAGDATDVRCGAGTTLVGNQCEIVTDAAGAETGRANPGSGADAAGAQDAGAEAEAPIRPLDPCHVDHPFGGCYQNRVYGCSFGSVDDPGQVTFTADCSVLGGTCVFVTNAGSHCSGGGYTPCTQAEPPTCVDAHTYEFCDSTPPPGATQTIHGGEDCRTIDPSYVCRVTDAGAGCGAP